MEATKPSRTKLRDQRAWRLVPSRILKAAEAVAKGQQPETVAKRFSKYVNPKDLVVWAHDFERLNETAFLAKYAKPGRKARAAAPKAALSLKDTAVAAGNEEHRLEVLERQLEQQLQIVRQEKKDVEELLGFLERKIAVRPTA
jgi:hypothetical protein